jgi:hypothetical protein
MGEYAREPLPGYLSRPAHFAMHANLGSPARPAHVDIPTNHPMMKTSFELGMCRSRLRQ